MAKGVLPQDIVDYIHATFVEESPNLEELRRETAKREDSGLQIEPYQGQFLALLVKTINARKTLEVGVYTGYSSLWTISGHDEDGHHTALELSDEYAQIAVRHWEAAGVRDRIDLRMGEGVASMDNLIDEGAKFDFIFIDADKPNYCNYFERAVQLLRHGGLIAIDNTLWSGKITDSSDLSESTVAIRQLNELVARDPRVESILVPIGDGITVARKK